MGQGTKESAAAAALPVARVQGGQAGRQQQRGVGLGLKDFLAASGNSEEGRSMAVAEISYLGLLGSRIRSRRFFLVRFFALPCFACASHAPTLLQNERSQLFGV